MHDGMKAMVEVASIELAYARAEIAMSARMGEERLRVFDHLDAANETLARLILAAGELEQIGGARRLTRKHVARLRAARNQLRAAGRKKLAEARSLRHRTA